MFPQYTPRQMGGELAIWLLITVGALVIPLIVVAICCIRHHLPQRPCTKLLASHRLHMTTDIKQMEALHSYNGPFMELTDNDSGISTQNKKTVTFSRPNSLKKQHVRWLDRPDISQKNTFFTDNIVNTCVLTESPSTRRHRSVLATLSSIPCHSSSTPIIPAGSIVHHTGTSQLLTSTRSSKPTSIDPNLIV